MKEIAPGIWRWTARHPEWHPGKWGSEVVAYALVHDDGLAVIDPILPPEPEPVLEQLHLLAHGGGETHVLITNPYHTRDSATVRKALGAKAVWGHPAVQKREPLLRLRSPGNRRLPFGAQALTIGNPRRQETPLYFPQHRAIVFGDSLVATPRGKLRVWESLGDEKHTRWYRDRLVPSLRPLLELDVERVLPTHGRPILRRGKAALREALEQDPWNLREFGESS